MDALLRIRRLVHAVADRVAFLPPLLARIAIGVVFIGTGWGKLHNLDKITSFFTELGIAAPGFNAVLVSTAELVCGALLLVGLFTRIAAVPLAVVMTVAIVTAKRRDISGLSDLLGFVETLYIVLLAWLATAGAGPISLDRVLVRALRRSRCAESDPAHAAAATH
jgi:putative oxidoreductase